MRLLHYLEIENFKRFGEKQRIERSCNIPSVNPDGPTRGDRSELRAGPHRIAT